MACIAMKQALSRRHNVRPPSLISVTRPVFSAVAANPQRNKAHVFSRALIITTRRRRGKKKRTLSVYLAYTVPLIKLLEKKRRKVTYSSPQLAIKNFFGQVGDLLNLPTVLSAGENVRPLGQREFRTEFHGGKVKRRVKFRIRLSIFLRDKLDLKIVAGSPRSARADVCLQLFEGNPWMEQRDAENIQRRPVHRATKIRIGASSSLPRPFSLSGITSRRCWCFPSRSIQAGVAKFQENFVASRTECVDWFPNAAVAERARRIRAAKTEPTNPCACTRTREILAQLRILMRVLIEFVDFGGLVSTARPHVASRRMSDATRHVASAK